eukprot:1596928-Alexandrium_andersonii.AAC.1
MLLLRLWVSIEGNKNATASAELRAVIRKRIEAAEQGKWTLLAQQAKADWDTLQATRLQHGDDARDTLDDEELLASLYKAVIHKWHTGDRAAAMTLLRSR